MKVYKDKAGNSLFITGRNIYAKNKQNKLVSRRGVITLLKRAGNTGKIKFKERK